MKNNSKNKIKRKDFNSISPKNMREIECAVKRVIKEYGETLRMLGRDNEEF